MISANKSVKNGNDYEHLDKMIYGNLCKIYYLCKYIYKYKIMKNNKVKFSRKLAQWQNRPSGRLCDI